MGIEEGAGDECICSIRARLYVGLKILASEMRGDTTDVTNSIDLTRSMSYRTVVWDIAIQ
jgi:hypothetical protein